MGKEKPGSAANTPGHDTTPLGDVMYNDLTAISEKQVQRFWAKVDVKEPSECWLWVGARDMNGYGKFSIRPMRVLAHRVAYTLTRGKIPDGLVLDHLCCVTSCVNPSHLEPVTITENVQRGRGVYSDEDSIFPNRHSPTTHCTKGHERTEENTYWVKSSKGSPKRKCRQCVQSQARQAYAKNREKVLGKLRATYPDRREKVLEYGRTYREQNHEKVLERKRQYRARMKEQHVA